MSPAMLLWLLLAGFAFVVDVLLSGPASWPDYLAAGIASAIVGFVGMLALVALTHRFDYQLWRRLFGD